MTLGSRANWYLTWGLGVGFITLTLQPLLDGRDKSHEREEGQKPRKWIPKPVAFLGNASCFSSQQRHSLAIGRYCRTFYAVTCFQRNGTLQLRQSRWSPEPHSACSSWLSRGVLLRHPVLLPWLISFQPEFQMQVHRHLKEGSCKLDTYCRLWMNRWFDVLLAYLGILYCFT